MSALPWRPATPCARITGRKALIVLSDGVDTASEIPLSTAVEEAQRAGTLVYSIVFSDANAYGTSLGPLGGGAAEGKARPAAHFAGNRRTMFCGVQDSRHRADLTRRFRRN